MILKLIGVIILVALLVGIYTAFADEDVSRCHYSEATHDTECYDPR